MVIQIEISFPLQISMQHYESGAVENTNLNESRRLERTEANSYTWSEEREWMNQSVTIEARTFCERLLEAARSFLSSLESTCSNF